MFGIYEGIHPKVKETMRQWLDSEIPKEKNRAHFNQLLKLATQDVENAQHSVAKHIANFVKNAVEWRSSTRKKQKPTLSLEALAHCPKLKEKDLQSNDQSALLHAFATKSDTAIEAFRCAANQLHIFMCRKVKNFLRPVPDGKWAAHQLHQRQFSPDQVQAMLQENPTLAAQLMSTAVDVMENRFRSNVSD